MVRHVWLSAVVVSIVGAFAAPAAAQFGGGFITPVSPLSPVSPVMPVMPVRPFAPVRPLTPPFLSPFNPVTPLTGISPVRPVSPVTPVTPVLGLPQFNYAQWYTAQIGPLSYSEGFYGPVGYRLRPIYSHVNNNTSSSTLFPTVDSYGSYMSGGVRNPAVENAPAAFARAQRQATDLRNANAARTTIYDQWAYEKLGVAGLPGVRPGEAPPEALAKALATPDLAQVVSGEALNHIVVAVLATQDKGGKGDSAYLPPNLLAEVRFAGSPNADALNALRMAGRLEFPAAFDEVAALASLRADLEKDFAAAAAPALVGKASEPVRITKLDATLKKAQDALTPAIKELDFADATAARRFLNHLDAASKVLRTPAAAGLVDPKWATEGTSVADLVKLMARYKLLFGATGKGHEEEYLALHRGLAAYLFVLNDSLPKPKK